MPPRVAALMKGMSAIGDDVVKSTLRCSTELTRSRINVAPEFEHIWGADRVDLCIEKPRNDTRTRTINQIFPREVKWDDIIPFSPNTLTKETSRMLDVLVFMFC